MLMRNEIKKILIANRGEIAVRIIRTCKELGIKTVAVYSTCDKESLHVKMADEVVCIGPPQPRSSYLNISSLISAAKITGADAIHPGYGFLAENEIFARTCERNGITFIGPSFEAIALMGDKVRAKEIAQKAGVPVVPGSKGVVNDISQVREVIKKIGYPAIIKAAAGGGGKGMKIVNNEKELEQKFYICKEEAKAAFNDDSLFIEKYIKNPKHIEVQIIGDMHGNVIHLSERECSVQRKHQKIIEEAPSPVVSTKIRKKITEAAVKLAKYIKYYSAGTMEFIMDEDGNFYFIEMNTRIQVEHPVTEILFMKDIVALQIAVARGEKLPIKSMYPEGIHAIECRINAEDTFRNFMPSPGKITKCVLPGGNGIRVDTHIYTGYEIPPYYDSLIAKVIAFATDRKKAIEKMKRALSETIIEGEGVSTNIPLLIKILNSEEFQKGKYSTHLVESILKE